MITKAPARTANESIIAGEIRREAPTLLTVFDDIDFTCGECAFIARSSDDNKEDFVGGSASGAYEFAFNNRTALQTDFGWNDVGDSGRCFNSRCVSRTRGFVTRLAKRSANGQESKKQNNNACYDSNHLQGLFRRGRFEAKCFGIAGFTCDFFKLRDRMKLEKVPCHFSGGGITIRDGFREGFLDDADDAF